MALQSAQFDDTTDPMQQVRRRIVNRLNPSGLEPSLGPDLAPPVQTADFIGPPATDFKPPDYLGPPVREPMVDPLPPPVPSVPGATPPFVPPERIPPPIDLAPTQTPKITAGPVATAPLTNPTFEGADVTTPGLGAPGTLPDNLPNPTSFTAVPGYEGDVQTGKPYADVQGFDLGKITSGGGSSGKYTPALRVFSQAISGLDPNTDLPRALAYVKANGFPQAEQVGSDKIDFHDGNGPIDVLMDSGKGGWWFQNGPDRLGAQQAGGQQTSAPSVAPNGTPIDANAAGGYRYDNAGNLVDAFGHPVGGGGGGTTNSGSSSSFLDQVRAELMKRLTEAGQPVDENAAGISGAVSAARDEATRASEQERSALAERLYGQGAGGLQSDALTKQIQQSGETNARNLSTLRSGMIVKEFARKQQQLSSLLNMALASGDAELARNTQIQLANLQAQVQREGLGIDLAKFLASLNQQSVLAGLGG